MSRIQNYPISKKLTTMNLMVSAVALLLACTGFLVYDFFSFQRAMARNLSVQVQIIGANSVSALAFNDPRSAELTLSALQTSPRIIYAGIYTTDGRPFAEYWRDKNRIRPSLPKISTGQRQVYEYSAHDLRLIHTVILQGKVEGLVYIESDLGALIDRFRSYGIIIVVVFGMSLLAALAISRQAQKVISEPLEKLAETARVVSRERNYAVRAAENPNRDEISTFITAFNEMLGQIQQRDTALQAAHDELEERVKERTAELNAAGEQLRALSGRLLKLRDEERRQIARELHDSSGQMLAALAINLSIIQSGAVASSPRVAGAIKESTDLVQTILKEVRTISYLLHPPLLDDAGLESALRWFVEGFAERSKIPVVLEIGPSLGRLPPDLETALFRIIQECLTNIHRHSESARASIHIRRGEAEIKLEVQDYGKGMPRVYSPAGVGIQGMRERVRQLGGILEISSDSGKGTRVTVILPVHAAATA